MDTTYNLLLSAHVLASMIWLGGGVVTQIFAERAKRALQAGRPDSFVSLVDHAVWAGNRVFMPASILTALSGILLVVQGPWRWEMLWVVLGIVGFVLTAVNGAAILGPTGKHLQAAIAEGGATSEPALATGRRLFGFMRVDVVLVVLVVLDMTLKPGL